MTKKEFLTVAEYAEIKGISKQAVYKQLNNQLKPFVEVVERKKCIKIEALNEVEKEQFNRVEQPFNQVEQQFNNLFQPLFEKQIEEKDKTIQSLLRQIENLQEQNSRLTELLHNSQYLIAAEQRKAIEPIQQQDIKQEIGEQKEKQGFLKRLFSKK